MSNKIKLSKQKLVKLKRPTKLTWLQYTADWGGCGYIRVIYPSLLLNQLNDKEILTESLYTNRFSPYPESYQKISFVVFQRSATPQQYQMIKFLKEKYINLKIYYEIDDSLFDIPKWNFAYDFYNKYTDTIKQILKIVDGVITSTDNLKKKLLKYNKNIQVIPNHLPKFIWNDTKSNVKETKRIKIGYAGSFNHFSQKENKGDFDKTLIDFIEKTSDLYEWVFVGGIPFELKNNSKITHYDWQSVMSLPNFLKNLNIDIMIAPLDHNTFNESKSNIKALESIALGCPLIATDIEPYKNLTDLSYTTEGLIHNIEMLASNVDLRQKNWEDNYNILKHQLYWEENGNLWDYVNSYLKLTAHKL
jgi:glycosyltransferase involved in cell wall biosynthesis